MNPATSSGTRQQPGNAVCRHQPKDSIAALTHVCKRCGTAIEAVHCWACNGSGMSDLPDLRCRYCHGTGIDRWEAVP